MEVRMYSPVRTKGFGLIFGHHYLEVEHFKKHKFVYKLINILTENKDMVGIILNIFLLYKPIVHYGLLFSLTINCYETALILGCTTCKQPIRLHKTLVVGLLTWTNVNLCQKLSFNVSAFEECISNGEKLGFHKMLLGRRWHYEKHSFTITVPDKFISLVKSSIQDCQSHLNTKDEKISVCSNNCVVKFYTNTGHLTQHEVGEDDFWYSYRTKGRPVVSMFIGDSAEFFCSDSRNVNEADKVWLESGDVLIFSNKSRDISLGLHRIIPNSAPLPFLEESMLKPGLLNLSFRRF
ncbi:alpha-ketoglutarate-dependent dioxygenase abh1 [Artemisia annua]|uniref:Alpha-ketoglutarate-dependent dioxygenase abh1 n=1 Tax=Artemisia annua TaxID=35608 RepID=A0A2U1N7G6_ARTAN|nr:alpha-ketoglutarate-dependent dioxygenase abh1 [Artemisia annua]